MIIRKYEQKDWKRICVIHDEARKIELNNGDLMDAYLTLDETYENEDLFGYDILVAENEDKLVVGFTAFTSDELAWLYVDPVHHNKGIATLLVDNALKEMDDIVLLEVIEHNNEAISFYKKIGFTKKEKITGKLVGNESYDVTCYILEYNNTQN